MRTSRRPSPSSRLLAGLHLRQARRDDLATVAAFCHRHAHRPGTRSLAELGVLLRGHLDTVILALRERTLVGVALCGITQDRARLLELIVEPHPGAARVERRLLRRSLGNLRALGVRSLDFSTLSTGAPAIAPPELHPRSSAVA